ncbi:MAG: rRNA maturation RNase YbeY, partial [Acidobacteriota bacterium]
ATGAPAPACQIDIQNPCRYPDVGVRALRPLVSRAVAELAPAASSFVLRFISDREMRRLNGTYRSKDRPTDVLSFPGDISAANAPGAAAPGEVDLESFWRDGRHLGDVAISMPAARRQAAEQGIPVDREIRVLALHGILHCLGYDHESDNGEMENLEQKLRRRFIDGVDR